MNLASATFFTDFPVHGQYVCTVLLIVICVVLAANIAVKARADKAHGKSGRAESQENAAAGTIADNESAAVGAVSAAAFREGGITPAAADFSRVVYGNYDRSFIARLILADGVLKERYVRLADELLGYKKMRSRISWAYATFACGRCVVARVAIKGKTLCLYLALDPAAYTGSKRGVSDVSGIKKYSAVPTRIKVRSERGVSFASRLISLTAGGMSLSRGDKAGLRAEDYPYEPFESLLARGLIRLRTKGGVKLEEGDTLRWAGFERRERISAAEVRGISLPKEAVRTVPARGKENKRARQSRKGIVNIDTLSDNFSAGDTIDISAMKAKGLIAANETSVKVLARGVLDKPLTVIADDYSLDAIKMISLTGGKALYS